MCPSEAKIFYLDDDSSSIATKKEFLEDAGHSVPLIAHTKKEAMEAIDKFEEYDINVAVLDRNLDPNDYHNVDGESVAREIRKTHPKVIIIGNSKNGIICSDFNNYSKSATDLVRIVTEA